MSGFNNAISELRLMRLESDPEALYDVQTAARMMHWHPESVRRLVRRGELAAYRFPGKHGEQIRIRRRDLLAWQESYRRVRTSPPATAEQSRPNPDKPSPPPGAATPDPDKP